MDIGFEDFTGFVLGEGNVVSVHLALAADFTNCHYLVSLIELTIVAKAWGSLTASSARILRSIAILFFLRPAMSWE